MQNSLLAITCFIAFISSASAQPPKSLDPRLEIVQFAASPDIVHPIAVDFDAKGRLLVIESHTHFRPKDYKGPTTDRIRIVEDTDGDGKADKFTTFYEGTKFTMDLAVHPDGSVYVATRNEILRLRDTKGTGKADEVTRLMFLDTKGNYPHNGLSGLCFDFKGDLYFGLGENLGESYKLTGADGAVHKGGGEGGNIFWCTADGKKLRRVATGFWNPFGICRDVFGRVFAVDNDPDSRPPCRLVHVVEGGDYGFQFRYGRSGRHPFQAWNGELPGTLPYVAGVGEAPCEVLAYESDGLPKDYLGTILLTSWGDHRLECYPLETKGASFTAKKKVVIQGGTNFRPVGLAVAPDGSLFMSDWVRRDYNLHGQGAIWQVRTKNAVAVKRPTEPEQAILSADGKTREAAARLLAKAISPEKEPMRFKALFGHPNERVREAFYQAWILGPGESVLLNVETRLDDEDPFIRQLAVRQIATRPLAKSEIDKLDNLSPRAQITRFLIHREANTDADRKLIPSYLASPIDDIRFLTAKWISDDLIKEARGPLEKAMKDPNVNSRLYMAYGTALARLNGEPVNEIRLADLFLRRAKDEKASAASRLFALRMVPTSWGGLQTEQLVTWTSDPSPEMRLEAVRALNDQKPSALRTSALQELVKNPKTDAALRREAMVGVAEPANAGLMLSLASDETGKATALAKDALRGLVNVPLKEDEKAKIAALGRSDAELQPFVDRVLGRPLRSKEAQTADVDVWLKRLDGTGDADAGRRVFFHPRLAGCFRCHRVDGRGKDVGPDLSAIGQRERRFILESILFPSREVAPQFQTWQVETADGKVRNGLLVGTDVDRATYVDEKGERFTVSVHESEARPIVASIMPDGLTALLTDQEIRDLLAYLGSRK